MGTGTGRITTSEFNLGPGQLSTPTQKKNTNLHDLEGTEFGKIQIKNAIKTT